MVFLKKATIIPLSPPQNKQTECEDLEAKVSFLSGELQQKELALVQLRDDTSSKLEEVEMLHQKVQEGENRFSQSQARIRDLESLCKMQQQNQKNVVTSTCCLFVLPS